MEGEIKLEFTDKILFEKNKDTTLAALESFFLLSISKKYIEDLISKKEYQKIREIPGLIGYLTNYHLSIFDNKFNKILASLKNTKRIEYESLETIMSEFKQQRTSKKIKQTTIINNTEQYIKKKIEWEQKHDNTTITNQEEIDFEGEGDKTFIKRHKEKILNKLRHNQEDIFYQFFVDLSKNENWDNRNSLQFNISNYLYQKTHDHFPYDILYMILTYNSIIGYKDIQRFFKIAECAGIKKEEMVKILQNLINNYFTIYKKLILKIYGKVSKKHIERYIDKIEKLKKRDFSNHGLETNIQYSQEHKDIKREIFGPESLHEKPKPEKVIIKEKKKELLQLINEKRISLSTYLEKIFETDKIGKVGDKMRDYFREKHNTYCAPSSIAGLLTFNKNMTSNDIEFFLTYAKGNNIEEKVIISFLQRWIQVHYELHDKLISNLKGSVNDTYIHQCKSKINIMKKKDFTIYGLHTSFS